MSQTNIKPAVITMADATDIHWRDIATTAIVLVDCAEPGCMLYGTPHLLHWGDMLQHTASVVSGQDTRVEVIKYAACDEIPQAESHWYVAGYVCDDDIRLTPERVTFFTAHYNSAVALADELNGQAV